MSLQFYQSPGRPRLCFREYSTVGPTLLLLHGVGRNSTDYDELAHGLVSRWRVLALDFRGHGDSDHVGPQASRLPAPETRVCRQDACGPGTGYRVIDYAGDVIEWARTQTSGPIVIFGHSLGAMVALAVVAECPENVRGAILEDPPFHTMGRRIVETSWHALFTGIQAVARRGGGHASLVEGLGSIEVPGISGQPPKKLRDVRTRESLEFSAECLAKVDPNIYTPIVAGQWLDGYDEQSLFGRIRCPLWLLQGDSACGGTLTDADAESALQNSKRVRRTRFSSVGHLIHQEQPEAVLQTITELGAELGLCSPSPGSGIPSAIRRAHSPSYRFDEMKKRVLCLLFPGFEEIETVAPIDLLRRAGVEVVVASLNGEKLVTGRCNITLQADAALSEVEKEPFDIFLIPGGPGIQAVRKDGRAARLAQAYASAGKPVAAICAAPTVLNDAGLLNGKRFTSHAGVSGELPSSLLQERVVEDGDLITSRGAATAVDFGLALVRRLCGDTKAQEVSKGIMA